jgi:hypothetical protein
MRFLDRMAPQGSQCEPRSTGFLRGGDQTSLGTQWQRIAALRLRKGEHMDDDEPAESSPLARIRQLHPRIQRRRDLASSLNFPADLRETFGKFTDSQRAVLKIISGEVVKHGACTLTKDAIADLSSVSSAVVKVVLRTANAERLIAVERTGRRNTITLSAKWKAWLDRYGDAPRTGHATGSAADAK